MFLVFVKIQDTNGSSCDLRFVEVDGYEYLEKVRTQVYFLPPIPYEEYGKLRKHDVCELVKKRIQEKLDELKEADPRR